MMTFPKPTKQKKKGKTEIWNEVRDSEIVPLFYGWGITTCEIRSRKCVQSLYLGFAHTKKRNDIKTPEELRRVVLACQPCHQLVEYYCMKEYGMTMTEYLDRIIELREKRLREQGLLR